VSSMGSWQAPHRRPRLDIASVHGAPEGDERAALAEALERIVDVERQARTPSMWLRAGRAQGRRLGMYDYRDRIERDDAWRLSLRFPPGGREYVGRTGRGDSR
jgi:hypothetical protein